MEPSNHFLRTCKFENPVLVAGACYAKTSLVKQCPNGYPRLAAFLSSEENFMLYRKFSFLQSRLLLFKQDELRALERDLDNMDASDKHHAPDLLHSRERDDARSGRRKQLIEEISQKFQEYGMVISFLFKLGNREVLTRSAKLVITARDLASFNKPPSQDYLSVKSYFEDEAPVSTVESYIYYKEDIVTLKPGREIAWLDDFLARVLRKFACRLTRVRLLPTQNYPSKLLIYPSIYSAHAYTIPTTRCEQLN